MPLMASQWGSNEVKRHEYRPFIAQIILMGTIGSVSIQTASKHISASSGVLKTEELFCRNSDSSQGIVLKHLLFGSYKIHQFSELECKTRSPPLKKEKRKKKSGASFSKSRRIGRGID